MQLSIINDKNQIINIIEADTVEEAKEHEDYNENNILVETQWFHKIGLDLNNLQLPNMKERIEKNEIVLEDNQIFDEKTDSIITIGVDQKLEDGIIKTKTEQERYMEGALSKEEYESLINDKRAIEYEENTDKLVIELMRNYLNRSKENLSEEEKAMLDSINNQVAEIKANNPKVLV